MVRFKGLRLEVVGLEVGGGGLMVVRSVTFHLQPTTSPPSTHNLTTFNPQPITLHLIRIYKSFSVNSHSPEER